MYKTVEEFLNLLPLYNLFAAAGLIAALAFARRRLARANFSSAVQTRILFVAAAGFFIGVAASNIFNWFIFPDLLSLPLPARILSAGFTFYPGMICALSATGLFYRLMRLPAGEIFETTVAAYPLFHAVARIGCFFAGCCYGRVINLRIGGLTVYRWPTQLMESLFLFLLFYILAFRAKQRRTLIYFTAYPIFRFFLEFLRSDDRGVLIPGSPLSVSQILSLSILAGVGLFLLITYRKKRTSSFD